MFFNADDIFSFFHHDFGGLKAHFNQNGGILFMPCFMGLVFKNVINTIEMKQGMLRIIDYDVEEKTMKTR